MIVHFIGAGPGAPDLITVRGRDLIARCPVCLYAGSLVPKALLAFVDETRAWVKSDVGTSIDWVPSESSFSELAIESDEPLVVPDVRKDRRFAEPYSAQPG